MTREQKLFIRDFTKMAVNPPFKVNVAGIVTDVRATIEGENGIPRTEFKLRSPRGKYVGVIAMGRHANNDVIVAENEIAIYFATGKQDFQHKFGTLWIFDESHIILLSRCSVPGSLVHEIKFVSQ